MAELQRLIKSGLRSSKAYSTSSSELKPSRSIERLHFITQHKPFPCALAGECHEAGPDQLHGGGLRQAERRGIRHAGRRDHQDLRRGPVTVPLDHADKPGHGKHQHGQEEDSMPSIARERTASACMPSPWRGLFIAEYDNICSIFTRDD